MALIYHNTQNYLNTFNPLLFRKIGENMSQPKIGKPLKNICNIDKIIIFDNFFTSFIKPPVKKIYKKKVLTRYNSI